MKDLHADLSSSVIAGVWPARSQPWTQSPLQEVKVFPAFLMQCPVRIEMEGHWMQPPGLQECWVVEVFDVAIRAVVVQHRPRCPSFNTGGRGHTTRQGGCCYLFSESFEMKARDLRHNLFR